MLNYSPPTPFTLNSAIRSSARKYTPTTKSRNANWPGSKKVCLITILPSLSSRNSSFTSLWEVTCSSTTRLPWSTSHTKFWEQNWQTSPLTTPWHLSLHLVNPPHLSFRTSILLRSRTSTASALSSLRASQRWMSSKFKSSITTSWEQSTPPPMVRARPISRSSSPHWFQPT